MWDIVQAKNICTRPSGISHTNWAPKWDIRLAGPSSDSTSHMSSWDKTIGPGSPYKKIPIRLDSYEKLLSLIGYNLG
jgi:hypothetical protein